MADEKQQNQNGGGVEEEDHGQHDKQRQVKVQGARSLTPDKNAENAHADEVHRCRGGADMEVLICRGAVVQIWKY